MPLRPPQQFLKFLRQAFGTHDTILSQACPRGGPEVVVYVFRDFPEKGMITGVTYGVSLEPVPAPESSGEVSDVRPELIISLESSDTLWPWNAAYLGAGHRGLQPFHVGQVFLEDEPLASDTQMEGLLVYTPSILEPADCLVKVAGYSIQLRQLYPVHRSELVIQERYGLPALWNHPGFEIYNPKRPPVVI